MTQNSEQSWTQNRKKKPYFSSKSEVTRTSRDVDLKATNNRKLESTSGVDRECAHSSIVEEKAKALWLLAVEQLEVVTA